MNIYFFSSEGLSLLTGCFVAPGGLLKGDGKAVEYFFIVAEAKNKTEHEDIL